MEFNAKIYIFIKFYKSYMVLEWVAVILLVAAGFFLLMPAKSSRYADIKEAPLHINNALKDGTKRRIMRSLKTEKKYLTVIAREVGDSVAKTKYHLAELERLGLVAAMQLTREKFFMLTKKGRWCLKAIDVYYPRNNLEKILYRIKPSELKWKETQPKI